MSFYLVAGDAHPPPRPYSAAVYRLRRRVYPSDTSDVEWNLISGLAQVGGERPARGC
jgi:hypothetical protein